MKRSLILRLVLAILAVSCSSSRPAPTAQSQIRFGARVAQQDLWREARFRFAEAVRLEPQNARAHNNLAVALEALGEYAAAFEEYKKAVAIAPGNSAIGRNYSRFAEFYTSYSKTVGKAARAQ